MKTFCASTVTDFFKQFIYIQKFMYVLLMHSVLNVMWDFFLSAHDGSISGAHANNKTVRTVSHSANMKQISDGIYEGRIVQLS